MVKYRIVKWSPESPEYKQPAIEQTFAELELAEQVKAEIEKVLPYRRFAVEEIELPPPTD